MGLKFTLRGIVFFCLLSTLAVSGFTQDALKSETPSTPNAHLVHLAIPKSLGKIEERFKGKNGHWIIHIQDVHSHVTAQENIAAILNHLNTAYGIKTVALEGAWTRTSFPKSWGLPQSPEKQMLAHALLEDYYLTGPGFAALFSDTPIELQGIETPEIYEANRQVYLKHLANREIYEKNLAVLAQQIQDVKNQTYNRKALEFDGALQNFREGQKSEEFLPLLMNQAETYQILIADLGQIALYKKIASLEKGLNKERLKSESERIVVSFKRFGLTFEELLKSGKVPAERLENFPQCKAYNEILTLQDRISHRDFFNQIETLIKRVKEKMLATPAEKELDARSERFALAKRFLLMQASPDDLKLFESQAEIIRTELAAANLEEALHISIEFYQLAKKRDDIFFEKISELSKNEDIAIVTGGFHTDGLGSKLQQADVPHIIITPELNGEAPDEKAYFEKLKVNPPSENPETNTLSSILEYMFPGADERLSDAITAYKRNKNQDRAKEIAENTGKKAADLSGFLILSRDEQVRQVEGWLTNMLTAQTAPKANQTRRNVKIMVKGSELEKLLRDPVAAVLWNNYIAPERTNTILLLEDGSSFYPDVMRAGIRRIPLSEGASLEDIISSKYATPSQRANLAILDENYKNGELLVLPVRPISLLLARLGISVAQPEILDVLESVLHDVLAEKGFTELLQRAA